MIDNLFDAAQKLKQGHGAKTTLRQLQHDADVRSRNLVRQRKIIEALAPLGIRLEADGSEVVTIGRGVYARFLFRGETDMQSSTKGVALSDHIILMKRDGGGVYNDWSVPLPVTAEGFAEALSHLV